jgi:hypothetical protein
VYSVPVIAFIALFVDNDFCRRRTSFDGAVGSNLIETFTMVATYDERIEKPLCPICRYDLTGHPTLGQCPECGFSFDKRAILVEASRRPWAFLLIANGLTFLAGICIWRWSGRITVSLSCFLGMFIAWYRYARRRRFVYVSPTEIRVITGKKAKVFPINQIHRVVWSKITGNLSLDSEAEGIIATIPYGFFQSKRLAQKVVRAFEKLKDENT